MVHEGPIKICETYLAPDQRGLYPADQVLLLEAAMTEFIKLCGFAVKMANQVIELRHLTEYTQFQEMIEQHYNVMRETMRRYFTTNASF